MKITLSHDLARIIGIEKLEPFGIDGDSYRTWGNKDRCSIDLTCFSTKRVRQLEALLAPHGKKSAIPLRDTRLFLKIVDGNAAVVGERPKTVQHLSVLLRAALQAAPGHRLYKSNDSTFSTCDAFVVTDIVEP